MWSLQTLTVSSKTHWHTDHTAQLRWLPVLRGSRKDGFSFSVFSSEIFSQPAWGHRAAPGRNNTRRWYLQQPQDKKAALASPPVFTCPVLQKQPTPCPANQSYTNGFDGLRLWGLSIGPNQAGQLSVLCDLWPQGAAGPEAPNRLRERIQFLSKSWFLLSWKQN